MSQPLTALPPPEPRESLHVSSVTVLLLVLVPCVLLLLLLHCLLLGYKLLLCARTGACHKRARGDLESSLVRSSPCTRRRIDYVSVSEPVLAVAAACAGRRCGSVRPDGSTYPGSGSLHVPSTVLGVGGSCGWTRSAPVLLQSSDSENERVNVAPPNTPARHLPSNRVRAAICTASL